MHNYNDTHGRLPPAVVYGADGEPLYSWRVLLLPYMEGEAFEGAEGKRLPDDFPDGTSNTLLLVEAGTPVPWAKPEDLPYASDRPLPELRSLFQDGFRACRADGSLRWVKKETSEAALRAAVTRN